MFSSLVVGCSLIRCTSGPPHGGHFLLEIVIHAHCPCDGGDSVGCGMGGGGGGGLQGRRKTESNIAFKSIQRLKKSLSFCI